MNIEQMIYDIFSIVNQIETMNADFEALANSVMELLPPLLACVAAFLLAVTVLGWMVKLAVYAVRSLSMHIIAKRRGIQRSWLAWIPVGRDWVLGALSDDYRRFLGGKHQYRDRVLLGLSLAALGLNLFGLIPMLMLLGLEASGGVFAAAELVFGIVAIELVTGVVGLVVGLTRLVFHHICIYDVYRSCLPKYSVLFLIVGIFLGFTEPFFLLACRNKDEGMTELASADDGKSGETTADAKQDAPAEKPAGAAPEQKPEDSKPEEPKTGGEPEQKSEEPKTEPEAPTVIHLPAGPAQADDSAANP